HYARMAHELFEIGFTHMIRGAVPRAGGKFLKPDEDLRTYAVPRDAGGTNPVIPEADWLMLASIRQAYDFWGWEHFYKAKPDEGGTYANDMLKFYKDTGYAKVIDGTGKSNWQSLPSAMHASQYVSDGYKVVLFINGDLLVGQGGGYVGQIDLNRVVGLVSPITGVPNAVNCDLYPWGTKLHIPGPVAPNAPPLDSFGNMKIDTFLKYFFGFIAAKY